MNEHYQEKMPLYVAGLLDVEERNELEIHLAECSACQGELDFWRGLSSGIIESSSSQVPPNDLAQRALQRIYAQTSLGRVFQRAFYLLRAQVYLLKSEMWISASIVMALGVVVALLSSKAGVVTFIAPLIAAASLATVFGPENDPASELIRATPTSAWRVLLARLSLVSGYNLLLALLASVALLSIVPVELLGSIILAWLGPMTFLSALALLLSLWIGTSKAVTVSYGLWIAQYLRLPQRLIIWPSLQMWNAFLLDYRQFWQSPALLVPLAAVLVCLALWSAHRMEPAYTGSLV
jgi:hypothetical protein